MTPRYANIRDGDMLPSSARMLGFTTIAAAVIWGAVLAFTLITVDPLGIVHAPECVAPC